MFRESPMPSHCCEGEVLIGEPGVGDMAEGEVLIGEPGVGDMADA